MAIMALFLTANVQAQDKVVKKIIETGKTDNQVMKINDHLSNYIGGRPIGS